MSQHSRGRKKQPHYPVEVKQAAVDRVLAGESMAQVALSVGCGRGRIHYSVKRWEKYGGWPELGQSDRSREPAAAGSAAREAELERLAGRQQAELDFLREALRLMEQVRRPTAEPVASSPTSSLRAGRLPRRAD
jgi:transposase-like protein